MTLPRFSRREFLKFAGVSMGVMAVSCSGLGYAAIHAPEFVTPEIVYSKDDIMNKRILISYATHAGSTPEIAAVIGETLARRGFSVVVKPVNANPSLNGCDAVILGSAVHMANWLPEMVDFIKKNQVVLSQMPVALFTVHILNLGNDEASRVSRLAYLNSVRPLLDPMDEVFFAGKIDLDALSFVDRLMVKMVKSPIGDYRDWDGICAWSSVIF
ncbi:MAG: flavodoxin domain-containing protein [Anaerolineaceae bacterium]|nr:flavodoxin domain-containing protein [Anaerolineaceae bacterium]